MTRQGFLQPLTKEARNAVALISQVDLQQRRSLGRKATWGGVNVASSKAQYREGGFGGYRNSSGLIYFLCPFHRERTPSCVWYPKERMGATQLQNGLFKNGTPIRHLGMHFHCYGCGRHGSLNQLVHALRQHAGVTHHPDEDPY